jgi:2-methylcitrate dehydratase PrpD
MTGSPRTVAGRLADWAAAVRLADVPEPARAAACRHLLDGLGTALGALRRGDAVPAIAVARGLGGPPEATLLGTRERLGAPAAALAAGTMVHALDFDDTHAVGLVHATAVTLPVALAVGEQVGASGAEVLAAAVAGYEVTCRVAAAVPYGFQKAGRHATYAAGVFGAATVAGKLAGLPPERLLDALGIAGSMAGGLLEFLATGAATKQLHPGLASHAGILAARLAAAGADGPATVLDGRHGVWATMSATPADPNRALAGLGESWEVTRITLKPYPACQLSHAALDATAAVLDGVRAAGGAANIDQVVALVHPDSAAIVCEPAAAKVAPRTPYDAKFSLPWSVAALLLDGRLGVATYDPASVRRPEVAELAARVRTAVAPAAGVAADAPGRVVVRLRDGRELVGEVAGSRGGPAAPLDDAALLDKLAGLAGDGVDVGPLARTVRDLAAQPDLDPLLAQVAAATNQTAGAGVRS